MTATHEVFLTEAKSHLETMSESLLKLERTPKEERLLFNIFRSTHTLKSMAATMEFLETVRLSHVMEDLLDAIRNDRLQVENCADLLFDGINFLFENLKAIEQNKAELNAQDLIENMQSLIMSKTRKPKQISVERVHDKIEKIQSIEVKVERLDTLLNLIEELLVNKMQLESLARNLQISDLFLCSERISRLITDLQYNVMQIRMIPLGFVFKQFPRMVRDLSRKQHKEIELIISGSEIELDRTIIEEITESLVHIIRNAIDHGIETKEVRAKLNKPSVAQIKITALREKESVIIEISDDGAGLNLAEIRKAGIKKGIFEKDESNQKIINSIFSGISTTKSVTEISGRGLGLNIVKQKIESIDGAISVKTIENKGVTFRLEIPISLAVLMVLIVKVNKKKYGIPVSNIERLVIVHKEQMKQMINYESIILDEINIPIVRLHNLFSEAESPAEKMQIVIVNTSEGRLGLLVDELMNTQEVVIKPLGRHIINNLYFSGSAIVGSGEIVLILDILHLVLKQHFTDKSNFSDALP